MQTTTKTTTKTVFNAVPMLLHRLLKGVNTVVLKEFRLHRGILGAIGGAVPPQPHNYDLSMELDGISTTAALETLVATNQPAPVTWFLRHRGGAEIRANGWRIDRYHQRLLIITVTTTVPGTIVQLIAQIEQMDPLVWDVQHPSA